MVKKLRKMAEKKAAGLQGSQLAATVKESAQQIWLAGLGAFAKAQEEGTKVFEALVKEGATVQTKSQAAAEGRPGPGTTHMGSIVGEITGRAGHWDKLEAIFEDRVAKALNHLGVPSNRDLAALAARIEGLDKTVSQLAKGSAAKAASEATAKAKAKSTTAATKATPKASSKSAAKPAGRNSNGSAEPAAKRVARKSAA